MTHTHFQAIADTLRPLVAAGGLEGDVAALVARDMATTLAALNPHFNREWFLRACGADE